MLNKINVKAYKDVQNKFYLTLFFLAFTLVVSSCTNVGENDGGKTQSIKSAEVGETTKHNDKLKSKQYSFVLLRQLPHDTSSFTQGLLYDKGYLYESTGLNGKSTLQKINYLNGEVVSKEKISSEYFAEGLSLVEDVFYLLTYQEGKCFTYSKDFKKQPKEFNYQGEGWGLCYDGQYLIKSNGLSYLEFRKPNDFSVVKKIMVKDVNSNPLPRINEMEYINNRIWANVWGYYIIVVINPETGLVENQFDFSYLIDMLKDKNSAEVMNGIAYNPEKNTIILTGKNWDTMFEFSIIEN